MEALQLAQMLADLNDLQAAQEQQAAKNLVSANKNLDDNAKSAKNHKRSLSIQSPSPSQLLQPPKTSPDNSRMHSPMGKFDKLGRRIFTPPLTRTSSATGSSSIPGTPRYPDHNPDGDIDRASSLLSLYEIRAKLKEQDNSSLMRAREKINALAAKQTQTAKEQQNKMAPPSKDSHYTYPKSG